MSEAKKAAIKLRQEVVKEGLWPCCLNCEHWKMLTGEPFPGTDVQTGSHRCAKYEMIPPASTIVVGCPHHLPDIPF